MSSWVHLIDQQAGLAFVGLAGVLLLCCLGEFRHRQRVEQQCLCRAAEKGLTRAQARLLMGLARARGLGRPSLLLESLRSFDACVGRFAARMSGENPGGHAKMLEELARIRAALGFDRLAPDQVMHTTRQVQRGQRLALWRVANGSGQRCTAMVVSRDEGGIGVVFLGDGSVHWQAGDEVAARLWHGGKAEYRFRTKILKTAPRESGVVLGHAEQVQRVQARRLFRWDTHFEIRMYPVAREGTGSPEANRREPDDGQPIEGVVTNISGGGFSVLVSRGVSAGALLVVDPHFRGSFPLAGLGCEVVAVAPAGRNQKLRLRFVDLPRKAEAEIVRAIYRSQSADPAVGPANPPSLPRLSRSA